MQIPKKQTEQIDHAEAGKVIRGLREAKGQRQKEVASGIGISIPLYSAMEAGKRNWTEERFNKAVEVIEALK